MINNRVMGELAVSRAFGDVDFKRGLQVRGVCTRVYVQMVAVVVVVMLVMLWRRCWWCILLA